jgi:hypothetical protein
MKFMPSFPKGLWSLLTAILALGFSVATTVAAETGISTVVNAAPAFAGGAEAGRNITLSSLRGKPVLLVIAPSPRDHAFRKQMQELRGIYERLSAQGTVAFVAFTSEGGRIPSNIPFVLVNDPAATASAYDIHKGFSIAVIGRDGNLDCLSTKPLPGSRIYDLIMNNAAMQSQLRR